MQLQWKAQGHFLVLHGGVRSKVQLLITLVQVMVVDDELVGAECWTPCEQFYFKECSKCMLKLLNIQLLWSWKLLACWLYLICKRRRVTYNTRSVKIATWTSLTNILLTVCLYTQFLPVHCQGWCSISHKKRMLTKKSIIRASRYETLKEIEGHERTLEISQNVQLCGGRSRLAWL